MTFGASLNPQFLPVDSIEAEKIYTLIEERWQLMQEVTQEVRKLVARLQEEAQ